MPDEEWQERTRLAATAPDRAIFVAESDGQWLGCAAVLPSPEGPADILSLWVDPAVRRSGTATALLQEGVEFARAAGDGRVRIWHVESNAAAQSLFRRFGFRPTGRSVALERDPTVFTVEMELPSPA